jgi:hypothetical protein
MTLTVANVRDFGLGASLADASLQALLDAAYASIDQRVAPSGTMRERLVATGPLLMLSRPADIVTEVIENGVELDDDDFELRGTVLLRLSTGPHGSWRWRGPVDLTYIPVEGDSLRDTVALQLVKLDLNTQHGLASQTIGDWSETYETGGGGYMEQREAILSALREPAYIL